MSLRQEVLRDACGRQSGSRSMLTGPADGAAMPHTRFQHALYLAIALLAAGVASVGCGRPGPRFCRIHGVVSIDGVPAREGAIRFEIVSAGDLPSGATIIEGGYEAWVTPGKKTVRISVAGSRDGLTERDLTPNIVPGKYEQTPPMIEVEKSGVFDFVLTSE